MTFRIFAKLGFALTIIAAVVASPPHAQAVAVSLSISYITPPNPVLPPGELSGVVILG